MDVKQKKKLLSSIYKAIAFFVLVSICWVGYYCCDSLIKGKGVMWLDITTLSFDLILFLVFIANLSKFRKFKNVYVVSNFLFYISFILFCGIIAGVFSIYYLNISLDSGYYLTLGVLIIANIFSILLAIVNVSLIKIYKNTSIIIDEISEIPTYDDELMLKKQLDELNRKLEMKKVANKIEDMKKELEEN